MTRSSPPSLSKSPASTPISAFRLPDAPRATPDPSATSRNVASCWLRRSGCRCRRAVRPVVPAVSGPGRTGLSAARLDGHGHASWPHLLQPTEDQPELPGADRQSVQPESVTYVSGINCHPCDRKGPSHRHDRAAPPDRVDQPAVPHGHHSRQPPEHATTGPVLNSWQVHDWTHPKQSVRRGPSAAV